MQKFKFDYDKKNDDLFLFSPKSKSKGSIELGDIVLDFNKKKEFVGIQLINASKLIKELVNENSAIVRDILNNLSGCEVDVKTKGNLLIIKLYLFSKSKEVTPIISVPNIRETSPALAYAYA